MKLMRTNKTKLQNNQLKKLMNNKKMIYDNSKKNKKLKKIKNNPKTINLINNIKTGKKIKIS